MKQPYVKPLIRFESFVLSQTIARNCGDTHNGTLGQSTHADENTCAWDMGGGDTIFYDHCNEDMTPSDEISMEELLADMGYCYNNPSGLQTVFSST